MQGERQHGGTAMNPPIVRGRHVAVAPVGMRRRLVLGAVLLLVAHSAFAGMQDILEAIQSSEFRFARATSEVPFPPLGWMQNRFYPNARFDEESGVLPQAEVVENTINLGGILPGYVANRDMLVVGGDLAWDHIAVRSGPYPDQSVLRLTPAACWLHQFGETDMAGAFAAPVLSKELLGDGPWNCNGYGGVVGMHWLSDQLQLLYGGVYQHSFGQNFGYPYFGVLWNPTPRCSLNLVFPWPTFSYVPADRWLLQLGVSPGGSSWAKNGASYEVTESLTSWNLTAGAAYRFHGKLWLLGGAGVAGLRGFQTESQGDTTRFEARPGPVFTLAVQFRP